MKTYFFPSIRKILSYSVAVLWFLLSGHYSFADSTVTKKIVTYPAPAGEQLNEHYKISVEGHNVAVYSAKVAPNDRLDPFVGVNTGRSQDYYDIAGFGYFDLQGSATVTITVPEEVLSAKVLPTSAGIKTVIHGHSMSFRSSSAKNLTIEINGEWERSLHLFVNPIEKRAPKPGDPNVIYFGPGIHTISHLEVGDNQTVYLAGGAILRAVVDSNERYKVNKREGLRTYSPAIVLSGRHITFRGRGIIDASACPVHSRNMMLVRGKDVTIEGVIFRDSPTWNLPIRQSDHVTVDNIKIFGFRSNSDGIDVCNSRYVTVTNCFLRTMDDLIVIKADKGQGECAHITTSKCVLWNEIAHALSIGAEVMDNMNDVIFRDCDIIHDKGREWTLRVYQCNAGYISHVKFENIRVEESRKFISVWVGHAIWSRDKEFGYIDGVSFTNITAAGSPLAVELIGADNQHMVKDVSFNHVLINGHSLTRSDVNQNIYVSGAEIK
jgi:polygalacturonase